MKVFFSSDQLIEGAAEQLRSEPVIFREDDAGRGLPAGWQRFVADVGNGIDVVLGTMQFASIREANISIIDRRTNRCHVCLFNDCGEMTAVDVVRGVSQKPIRMSDETLQVFSSLHSTVLSATNRAFLFDCSDQANCYPLAMTA